MSLAEDELVSACSSLSLCTSSSTNELSEEVDVTKQMEEVSGSFSSTQEDETNKDSAETHALWAWPLNEEGFVRCVFGREKFWVALDFKYLLSKDADIRKFDTLKSSGSAYTFTIGLCSIKRPDLYFWRLEVYLFTHAEMILVEAYREVFPDYTNIPSVRVCKQLRKIRKTYRLPEQYDITTATVSVSEKLGAIVIEALPKARP